MDVPLARKLKDASRKRKADIESHVPETGVWWRRFNGALIPGVVVLWISAFYFGWLSSVVFLAHISLGALALGAVSAWRADKPTRLSRIPRSRDGHGAVPEYREGHEEQSGTPDNEGYEPHTGSPRTHQAPDKRRGPTSFLGPVHSES